MSERNASCSCGQLSLTCAGEPIRVSMCHCLACQKRTGSAFGIQALFAREHVAITGEATSFVRIGDGGGRATFHFCPKCGATVYYEGDWMDGFVAVPVGAFADPSFPPPGVAIYEARRHRWVTMPELSIERLD